MTKDEAVLAQTIEQLELMNRVLGHLRIEVLPKNPKMFALMAEGPLDEMRRLQTEIEELTAKIVHTPAAA
jgi:hypothetical protein